MDEMLLKSSQCSFPGKIVGCNKKNLFIKINDDAFDGLMMEWTKEQNFDVQFIANQLNYQLQLNALKWIKKHEIFPILIKNPTYSKFLELNVDAIDEQEFR